MRLIPQPSGGFGTFVVAVVVPKIIAPYGAIGDQLPRVDQRDPDGHVDPHQGIKFSVVHPNAHTQGWNDVNVPATRTDGDAQPHVLAP